jgi:hypothetical protein
MQRFHPPVPHTLADTGLPEPLVEQLLLKSLYEVEGMTGSAASRKLGLPIRVVMDTLAALKQRKLVQHQSAALVAGDYRFGLTDAGFARSELLRRRGAWSATAPVPFADWLAAVEQQTIRDQSLAPAQVLGAFDDLELPRTLLRQLGMALATGRTLFLYGKPGNGKTSIAERVTNAFGGGVFIPRLLLIDGQLVRVFDPKVHEPLPIDTPHDPRWVYCRRPTLVVGGELTLDMLDLRFNAHLGVSEAPLQLKSAGGTLVIDDLGRQIVSPTDLLNRWIVPLDRGIDYLTLPDGTAVEVPFDPFVVFSTNLDPSDLADEAFLRRIPFKLFVDDPDESTFRELVEITANRLGLTLAPDLTDTLVATYPANDRPMRACHPRDLLTQIAARQRYLNREPVADVRALRDVMASYFVELP